MWEFQRRVDKSVTYSFIASFKPPSRGPRKRPVAAKSEEREFDKTMNGSRCRSNHIALSAWHTGTWPQLRGKTQNQSYKSFNEGRQWIDINYRSIDTLGLFDYCRAISAISAINAMRSWYEVFLICLFVQVWWETPDIHICCFVIITSANRREIRDWLPPCRRNVVTSLSVVIVSHHTGARGWWAVTMARVCVTQPWPNPRHKVGHLTSHRQSQAGPGPCHCCHLRSAQPTISTMSNNSGDLLVRDKRDGKLIHVWIRRCVLRPILPCIMNSIPSCVLEIRNANFYWYSYFPMRPL